MEHDGCKGCRYENETEDRSRCKGCKRNAVDKYVKTSNADRIRNMTDEELANLLIVFDGEEDRYRYITASTKRSYIYSSSYSIKEAFREQMEWLESECDSE